jgi:hypothetical protein
VIRSLSRVCLAVTVALALILCAVPSAHARPLQSSQPTLDAGTSWFAAAWGWLTNLWTRADPPAAPQQPTSAKGATLLSGSGIGGIIPLHGSCIDPMGLPIPCYL